MITLPSYEKHLSIDGQDQISNYEFCPYDFEKWIQNSPTLSFINEPHSSIVNFIMVRLLLSDVRKRIELQTAYQTKEGTNTTCSEEWYN